MKNILVVLGIILLIGAGVAGIYSMSSTATNNGFFGLGASSTTTTQTPYASYAIPLGLAGFVLLIVGLVMKEK